MKTEDRKKLGKKSRKEGKEFEKRVYSDLVEKGWIVNRWSNDVKENQLVQAKTSWRRTPHGMFPLNLTPGFPDFVCHKLYPSTIEVESKVMKMNDAELGYFMDGIGTHKHIYTPTENNKYHEVIGVECKITGVLDKPEKDKCKWLLENQIFSCILIAEKTKVKNRVVIIYHDFEEKYGNNN